LDEIGDFSLIAHCFAQPLEDMILVQNILRNYALDIAVAGAHSRHEI
jgi:hypothetical protein